MFHKILVLVMVCLIAGCDVFDDDNDPVQMPPITPEPDPEPPANTQEIDVEMTSLQVVQMGDAAASGTAQLTLNLDDGTLSGEVSLDGIEAESVSLNSGFAGEQGVMHTAFSENNGSNWTLPETALSTEEQDQLMAGGFFIRATSQQYPEGALRGQILMGTVELLVTNLTGMQQVSAVVSMASGRGFLTVDTASGDIVVNVRTMGAEDAQMGHIHQAIAGVNGGILVDLMQAGGDPGLWSSEQGAVLEPGGLNALNSGLLYYNIHTPANPAGEIRGQIEPEGIEIDFTRLTGGDVVVPGMDGIDTDASAIAATTLETDTRVVNVHLTTQNLDDATEASLNVAPEGQNGPVLTAFQQDNNNENHWLIEDFQLSQDAITSLRSQSLYFTVSSAMWPDGIIRGQWRPENSTAGGPTDTFQVISIIPDNGAELDIFPAEITVTFNRDVEGQSATGNSVLLTASGGDGSFDDGNEQAMNPLVINTTDNVLTVETDALNPEDDVFRLTIRGTGGALVTDTFGNTLDGDGDQAAGGDFFSTFSVVSEMENNATFTFIQENVFTTNCTNAGCHSGPAPAAGQNLTAGQAYNNIVNVPSTEVPGLFRIDPGDPDNSYLIQKVEGTAAVGDRMPLGMPPLPAETIQIMRQWVADGAPNN